MSILQGVGFTPGSTVQLATNGVEGVSLTQTTAPVDQEGTFRGTVAEDGYAASGPVLLVEHSGGLSQYACPPGATWTVTATDTAGRSASTSGTCP